MIRRNYLVIGAGHYEFQHVSLFMIRDMNVLDEGKGLNKLSELYGLRWDVHMNIEVSGDDE